MFEEKIKEVFSDEDFVNSLIQLETAEEVQAALAERDVELSIEEINQIAGLLQKKMWDGELTDEDLENITGGSTNIVAAYAEALAATISAVKKVFRRW